MNLGHGNGLIAFDLETIKVTVGVSCDWTEDLRVINLINMMRKVTITPFLKILIEMQLALSFDYDLLLRHVLIQGWLVLIETVPQEINVVVLADVDRLLGRFSQF